MFCLYLKQVLVSLLIKKNSINNFKYYSQEEILYNIPTLKPFTEDRFIKLNEQNIDLIYPFFSMILDSKNNSNLKQIISIHKLYCFLFNKKFKFEIYIQNFYKTSNLENAYSIVFEDFLTLTIGANFFNLKIEETSLYYFEIFSKYYDKELNTNNNHTNNIENLYLIILNIYLEEFIEVLNKDIKDITYQDIKLINMLTI